MKATALWMQSELAVQHGVDELARGKFSEERLELVLLRIASQLDVEREVLFPACADFLFDPFGPPVAHARVRIALFWLATSAMVPERTARALMKLGDVLRQHGLLVSRAVRALDEQLTDAELEALAARMPRPTEPAMPPLHGGSARELPCPLARTLAASQRAAAMP